MSAVAVFQTSSIVGEAVATAAAGGTVLRAAFQKLPRGDHGFHIHTAGDLRGKGCTGACAHWHKGNPSSHGGPPSKSRKRHTGDLGNVRRGRTYKYYLRGVRPSELWGRTLVVHADPDDYGLGKHDDSATTGHSGARIGCAIFGRGAGGAGHPDGGSGQCGPRVTKRTGGAPRRRKLTNATRRR